MQFAGSKFLNNMRILLIILGLAVCSYSNAQSVGDIQFDPKLDDPNFKVCNPQQIHQYYNFGNGLMYEGEKPAIDELFNKEYKNKTSYENQTGYISIRFVVTCEGKTGMFRVSEMSDSFADKKFDQTLVKQLLDITKKLNKWGTPSNGTNKFDYYQYLLFKIQKGALVEIMP